MLDPTGLAFRRAIGVPLGTPGLRDASGADEDELARRIALGDEDAFAELVRRRAGRMHALCRGILHNAEDAHDAVQSATEKALAALRRGQLRGDVRPWLTTVVRNEALSLLRVRAPWSELEEQRAATGPSPEATVLLRERLAGVAEDLAELPERQRRAIVLREVAELPYDRVARRLGMRQDAARQAVREARTALRDGDEGRDATCDGVRLLLGDGDGRRRRNRRVRSHLRICEPCRTWDATAGRVAQPSRALLPGLAALLPGSWSWLPAWSWLPGASATMASATGGWAFGGAAQAVVVSVVVAVAPVGLPGPGAERSVIGSAGAGSSADRGTTAGAAGDPGSVARARSRSGAAAAAGGSSSGAGQTAAAAPSAVAGASEAVGGTCRASRVAAAANPCAAGGQVLRVGSTGGARIVAGTGRSPVTADDDGTAGRDARRDGSSVGPDEESPSGGRGAGGSGATGSARPTSDARAPTDRVGGADRDARTASPGTAAATARPVSGRGGGSTTGRALEGRGGSSTGFASDRGVAERSGATTNGPASDRAVVRRDGGSFGGSASDRAVVRRDGGSFDGSASDRAPSGSGVAGGDDGAASDDDRRTQRGAAAPSTDPGAGAGTTFDGA